MADNTIIRKGYGEPVRIEPAATAVAITPGFLVELTSAGTIQAHSTAEGNVLPMFAVEDDLQGNDIDDNYAVSARIQCWVPRRGDEVLARLANGENVAIGGFVASNGDGYVRAHDVDSIGSIQTNPIIGQVLEAVDMSGSSGADPSGLVPIRIL